MYAELRYGRGWKHFCRTSSRCIRYACTRRRTTDTAAAMKRDARWILCDIDLSLLFFFFFFSLFFPLFFFFFFPALYTSILLPLNVVSSGQRSLSLSSTSFSVTRTHARVHVHYNTYIRRRRRRVYPTRKPREILPLRSVSRIRRHDATGITGHGRTTPYYNCTVWYNNNNST